MTHRLLIDCDPGIDDALALIWAERAADVEIVGVSLVGGNKPLEQVVTNAAGLRARLGASWPLGIGLPYGESGPPPHDAKDVHGPTGLGDVELDDADRPEYTAQEILEMEADHCVAIGPLSNVAAWPPKAPIVAMGGAIERRGNASSGAEFNVWADPHAVQNVIAARPIRLVPLDVTMQVVLDDKHLDALERGDEIAALGARIARHYVAQYQAAGHAGAGLHDPLAAVLTVHPDLASWDELRLDVGLDDAARGVLRRTPSGHPVQVAMRVDADAALDLFMSTLLG